LKQALASWEAVRGIENWSFVFMVEPSDRKQEMLDVINDSSLPNKTVVENNIRFGVLSNPWAGMNWAFEHGADFAFIAEEDVIVSDDILEYVEWCCEVFRDQESCIGVCANNRVAAPQDPAQVAQVQRFDPLGWGTWKDCWSSYLRDSWDHGYSSGSPSGWDHNINLRILPKLNKFFAFPFVSRSDHIGRQEGQHMVEENYEASRAPTFKARTEQCEFYLLESDNS